jgi:uncharacterized protein YndB with AHSA1/START domain
MPRDETSIEIRRQLSAAPQRVFDAFADVRRLQRWLSPSPDVLMTALRFEFRQGGAYRFEYLLPGGMTAVVGGLFHAIIPPSHIEMSWIWEPPDEHAGIDSRVMIRIAPDGAGTQLVIVHERLARPESAARHTQGWHGALDRLAEMLVTEAARHVH